MARRESLDFLLLTDHNTIRGASALAEYAKGKGLLIEVPLAAEYHTDHGDLIAAFVEREIVARRLDEFVAEVREQNGLILLPHPFVNHDDVDTLAAHADLIEVFNSRASALANAAAAELATRHHKPRYWASDAHLSVSLPHVIVAVDGDETLKASFLHGRLRAERAMPSTRTEIVLSQLVRVVKQRDVKRVLQAPWRLLRKILASVVSMAAFWS
jgi:predicted metal-dependent phosphoesterase TrpH